MTEMKTIPHITPEELHDFWPNGFDAGEVAGVCERAAAEIERLSRERDTGVPSVDQVCHDEQLSIWAEELLCELECWIEAPETYDDGVQCAQAAKQAIKEIVTTAFDLAAAPQPPTVSTQGWQDGALKDIGIERLRQMSVEGWTPEHDDTHDQFEMARAAAFYCVTTYAETLPEPTPDEPSNRYSAFHTADSAWPSTWDGCWRKPKDARRNLVRAAALIVAEIERLDRINGSVAAPVSDKAEAV